MEQAACGEMGLMVSYFYSLTPRQFYNHRVGYGNRVEIESQTQWLQSKTVAYFIYCSIPKGKGKKNKSFAEFDNAFFNTNKNFKPKDSGLSKSERLQKSKQKFAKIDG